MQLYCHGLFISKQAELDLCFDAMKEARDSYGKGIDWLAAFRRFISRVVDTVDAGL